MNNFESIPFTREIMKLLADIPKEQWDLISIPELVKRAVQNLHPQVLEINVHEEQETEEAIS